MAKITNTQARLIWGPATKGFRSPQWLPGENPLDEKYWAAIREHKMIVKFIELGFLEVDLDSAPVADPMAVPTPDALSKFSSEELQDALKDPKVPGTWHDALSAELDKRQPDTQPTAGLLAMSVEDAIELIKVETDLDTLVEWGSKDLREGIQEAVEARLTEIEGDGDE